MAERIALIIFQNATEFAQPTASKTIKAARRRLKFGAPGGIRTPNLLIRSQMLYPLSYGRSPLVRSA